MKLKTIILISVITVLFSCNPTEKEIPETLIGNYYDKSEDDFWTYSLQKKFVIFESQFWNVTKVTNLKDFPAGAVLQIVSCPTKAKNFLFFQRKHRSQACVSRSFCNFNQTMNLLRMLRICNMLITKNLLQSILFLKISVNYKEQDKLTVINSSSDFNKILLPLI